MKFLLLFATCIALLLHGTATAEKRPNVLFIAVDDMRVDLGCYGHTHIQSPHLDALAWRGTRFERAYCQQAVCNPSRASLLTGIRPQTLGIYDLPTHFRERLPDVVTLPQYFKQNGYFTQGIGKIFHNWRQDNYKGDAVSWSVPEEMHYNNHGADKPMVEGEVPPNLESTPRCEMRDVPDEAYFDGRIAKRAVEVLADLRKRDEPWFLAVGFWKPHAHFNAPKKYWDLYDREMIDLPENSTPPKNVPEIALHDGRELMRGFSDRQPTEDEVRALRHGYYAAISYVDAQIGKMIAELDRLELAEKTVIVFWSDHGYHLGEHGLWAKTSNFELDARVPLIIATPERDGYLRCEALVELLDLYPTLADLCGLPVPDTLEGKSLKPLLENPWGRGKSYALTWHPRPAYPGENEPEAMGHSIRTEQFRYTEWRHFGTGEVLAQELYCHAYGIDESINLAEVEGWGDTVRVMAARLRKVDPGFKPGNETSEPEE